MNKIHEPRWFFDEVKHGGLEFQDPDLVAAFDQKQRTDPERERALLDCLGVAEPHVLIEFGPGTGALALGAAKRCRRVIAVDVSAPMLSFIETKAEEMGLSNLECVQQGFLSYQHHGEKADFVVTQRALHHLPDFWKVEALRRAAHALKPGGVFYLMDVIFSFEPGEAEREIDAWIDAVSRETEDGWSREEFETHVREEYSTYAWLLEAMLEKVGFSMKNVVYDDLKTYAYYTCVKR